MARKYTPAICEDCKTEIFVDVNMVMINDELWKEIGMKPTGLLCDDCISKRMERPIAISDLKPSTEPGQPTPLCNLMWINIQLEKLMKQ